MAYSSPTVVTLKQRTLTNRFIYRSRYSFWRTCPPQRRVKISHSHRIYYRNVKQYRVPTTRRAERIIHSTATLNWFWKWKINCYHINRIIVTFFVRDPECSPLEFPSDRAHPWLQINWRTQRWGSGTGNVSDAIPIDRSLHPFRSGRIQTTVPPQGQRATVSRRSFNHLAKPKSDARFSPDLGTTPARIT